MSDYSNTFGGAAKDAANSTILGADHDTEYDAIATMSATKANKTGAPATTNNLAMLTATGDLADSLVESDGSGNITANVTGNLTGNVTGNVTGASTIDVDTITADTTNGDLELTRNGTGNITVDSVPIYGMVILDTPEVLSTATTTGSWVSSSGFASTTLPNAGAVKAIVRIYAVSPNASTIQQTKIYIRKTGSGLSASATTQIAIAQDVDASSHSSAAIGETTVNLDSNSDFDYYIGTGSGTAVTVQVTLVGYYV